MVVGVLYRVLIVSVLLMQLTASTEISISGPVAEAQLRCSPKSRQNIGQFKVVSAAGFKPCR